ncbi:hypothetical protein EJ05DRAFT_479106 [Pseudovirgaria hyperparasitica]|uniref:Secreted protein n=1 Tax=Pseudovirgaria hyperparasitica TaxID=470096 RepID=A0A6A6VZC6_9PEZI|nr:uncharacterized protein EJ05DRAFT_479106 [Pseudovirgaria hyperparasitica]KAF2754667.1 hypothetical protein EJ05DRAFT_479106 [Pseudovirgaria hyperparasitica]
MSLWQTMTIIHVSAMITTTSTFPHVASPLPGCCPNCSSTAIAPVSAQSSTVHDVCRTRASLGESSPLAAIEEKLPLSLKSGL